MDNPKKRIINIITQTNSLNEILRNSNEKKKGLNTLRNLNQKERDEEILINCIKSRKYYNNK